MRSFINNIIGFILFMVATLTGTAYGQGLSCANGVIPPAFVVPDANGNPVFHANTFLLYEPEGCEKSMATFIRIENKLSGTCIVPHWEGSGLSARVIMDMGGTPVPTIIRDQNGNELSCLESGKTAWTIAPSTNSQISADGYGNVKLTTGPGLPDRLDNGYLAVNMGLGLATPSGVVALPSPLLYTCAAGPTLMSARFDHTRDYVSFDNSRCTLVR